jgi:hypothetical protein
MSARRCVSIDIPGCCPLANKSDCGENVFSSGNHASAAQATAIICGDDDISANLPKNARSADLANAAWRKSSWSASNGNCVEVAALRDDLVGVRDSKEVGEGPLLVFDGAAWGSFIESIKSGQ